MAGIRAGGGRAWAAAGLQARIAASSLATAVAVLLAASVVFLLQLRQINSQSLKTEAREIAAVVAGRSGALIDRPAAANAELQSFSAGPSVREALIVDAAGRIVAGYRRPGVSSWGSADVVEDRAPILRDGRKVGEAVVRLISRRFGSVFAISLALTGALFFAAAAAALFIGRWLAKGIVGPVERLSRVMLQIGESGDVSARAAGEGEDEVGRLTRGFNRLLDRLEHKQVRLTHILQDLTEARDAAEAANVQKSQFLANMSHEIRTPLNGVLAMAQIMARDELSAEQRRRLEVVSQSGAALLSVLNDVLDVSKIEAGKLVLEPTETDVAAVVRSAMDAFGGAAEAKGLALTVEIAPEALGLRRADPLRLRQVVANLISNAVKFTERGAVTVRLRGGDEAGERGVRLSVSDTGIGVPAERLPQLFETFVQGDSSTTRRFGGTGLGLSICRDLVDMMGGAIWAESEPGRGSTFHVDLPLERVSPARASGPADVLFAARTPEAMAPPSAAAAGLGRPVRVLAAEDNATNQRVLATIMEVFGVSLDMVADGAQAVEAWRRTAPDLILMDIQMPEMDGVQAARAIRAAEQAEGRPRTPIVALSANAMTHQVREYLAAGMDSHVAKPIELNRLHAAMEAALADAEAARAAAA